MKMYHTLRERYPELNLVEAAQQWAAYKLDKPLRDNSNPRSQINTAFRNYLKWGKCLRKEEGDARVSGDTKRQFEDDRYASYFV